MKKTIICLGIALLSVVGTQANTITSTSASVENTYGHTPLCAAISKGDTETVRKFVEYGADVNEFSNEYSPLMIAARYNRTDIITLLLEKGANPKLRNERGQTALKIAEQFKAAEAAELLRSHS